MIAPARTVGAPSDLGSALFPLAHNVLRLLVPAKPEIGGMPHLARRCPLRKLHFSHQFRLDPGRAVLSASTFFSLLKRPEASESKGVFAVRLGGPKPD